MSPRHNLEAVAQALYGKRWHVELAADMGVTTREVRRWHTKPGMIEPHMRHRLRMVAERRMAACAAVIEDLRTGIKFEDKPFHRDSPEPTWIKIKRTRKAAEAAGAPEVTPLAAVEAPVVVQRTPKRDNATIVARSAASMAAYRASKVMAATPAPEPTPAVVEPAPSTMSIPTAPRAKTVSKAKRLARYAAVTAVEVRIGDKIRYRDNNGREHETLILNSDPEGKLHLKNMDGRRGIVNGEVYDPTRFVSVVESPSIWEEMREGHERKSEPAVEIIPEPVAEPTLALMPLADEPVAVVPADVEPSVAPVGIPEDLVLPDWLVVSEADFAKAIEGLPPKLPPAPPVISERERRLAALTASDVRVGDWVRVLDADGRARRAIVLPGNGEGRLRLKPLPGQRGIEKGDLFDPDRFVAVVSRPSLAEEMQAEPTPVKEGA